MDVDFLYPVDQAACEDTYYVDLGMHDVPKSGAAYIIAGDSPTIVETGVGRHYERILKALDALCIETDDVELIALTHVHLDHAGGAGYLANACPNATVATYKDGARHLVNPERLIAGTKQVVGDLWQFYGEPIPVPEERVEPLSDGATIDLGEHELKVHHAPGHADHQAIFYDQKTDWVFVGDAAGIYIPQLDRLEATTPPVDFDLEQSLADLEMIRELSPEGLLYTHFGPRSDTEQAIDDYRVVLTSWVNSIREKREELSEDLAVENYFVRNSDLVDLWGETKARTEAGMNVRGVLQYLKQ